MEVTHFRRGFRDVFLRALEDVLESPACFAKIRDAIESHALAIIDRHRHHWPASRDPYNLEFTAFMIGAWRALSAEKTDAEVRMLLDRAISKGFDWLTQKVRTELDASEDGFATLVGNSRERETHFFGEGFAFERVVDTGHAYHLRVTRCWYMDVLKAEKAMAIAPSFCAFDAVWYDAIDPARHKVRFTRPETIGHGARHCSFLLDRTDAVQKPHWRDDPLSSGKYRKQ